MVWTDEQLQILKDKWGKIRTQDIGEILGISKNAVCGMARRIHEKDPSACVPLASPVKRGGPKQLPRPLKAPKRTLAPIADDPEPVMMAALPEPPPLPPLQQEPVHAAPVQVPTPIPSSIRGGCTWPMWDFSASRKDKFRLSANPDLIGGEPRLCDAPIARVPGDVIVCTWCAEHREIGRMKIRERDRGTPAFRYR